jgi:predicted component of type VI protein secretion system
LFEQFDTNIADDIANDIEFAVANHEPRVQLIDVLVREVPEQNGIEITIKFRARNQVDVDQVDLFVERVR